MSIRVLNHCWYDLEDNDQGKKCHTCTGFSPQFFLQFTEGVQKDIAKVTVYFPGGPKFSWGESISILLPGGVRTPWFRAFINKTQPPRYTNVKYLSSRSSCTKVMAKLKSPNLKIIKLRIFHTSGMI